MSAIQHVSEPQCVKDLRDYRGIVRDLDRYAAQSAARERQRRTELVEGSVSTNEYWRTVDAQRDELHAMIRQFNTTRAIVRGTLDMMPRRLRRVLEMRYLEGWTVERIASILEVDRTTVWRLHREALERYVELSGERSAVKG